MTSTTRRAVLALLGAGALAAAWPAAAEQYPSRPIKLVAPFAAGGVADVMARLIGDKLSKSLGQPVIVENRPGAGGNVGADVVAKAAPDGYTLLAVQTSLVINAVLQQKVPYDPVKDFAPISKTSQYMFFLVVHPSLPARSVSWSSSAE